MPEIENPVFTVGSTEINVNDLPPRSLRALLSRGFTHYFGSEQASKVKTWKDKQAESGTEATEAEINAYKAQCVAEAIEKLRSGEIGVRSAGVTIDPLDKLRNKIAKQQVIDTLRKNNIKVPKGDEAVKFANGVSKTLAEMVATRLASNGDAIEAEAKKALAARNKQVAALPEGTDPEALGL